jgi:hypothetical protein
MKGSITTRQTDPDSCKEHLDDLWNNRTQKAKRKIDERAAHNTARK